VLLNAADEGIAQGFMTAVAGGIAKSCAVSERVCSAAGTVKLYFSVVYATAML
jgi:hypothetical protein